MGVDVLTHGMQVAGDVAEPIQYVLVWAHGDSPHRRVFPFLLATHRQLTAMWARGQSKVVPLGGTLGHHPNTVASKLACAGVRSNPKTLATASQPNGSKLPRHREVRVRLALPG